MDTDFARTVASMHEVGAQAVVVTATDGKPYGYITASSSALKGSTCADACVALKTTITVTADLRAAVSKMVESDMEWLACVDEAGRYVGTLDQRRITHLLGQTYRGGNTP